MPTRNTDGGKSRRRSVRVSLQSVGLMLGLPLLATSADALTIKPYFESSITNSAQSAQIIAGIRSAISVFETHLTNPVTVNMQFGYGTIDGYALTSGLGAAAPSWTGAFYSASQMSGFLQKTATSAADAVAYAHLPTAAPVGTAGYWVTTAQARAIGLLPATSTTFDGKIGFVANQPWTFDPTNGVAGGTYDFVAVAMSEISTVLGRASGLGPAGSNPAPSVLDMFRCSGGQHSFTFGTASNFAIDGCRTALQAFNPRTTGDTGDWDNTTNPADTFNAFKYSGVKHVFSAADLIAMDVIGWNTTTTVAGTCCTTTTTTSGGGGSGGGGSGGGKKPRKGAQYTDLFAAEVDVPEPMTLSLLGVAVLALGATRRRRPRPVAG